MDRYSQLAGLVVLIAASLATAADPRLGPLVHLRTDRFHFEPPATAEEWAARAADVRRQVQVAAGLWPPPRRPSPHATFHRRIVGDGYTVESVSIDTFPGVRLTGSLYRPQSGATARRPAVLSPHGHWSKGRFHRWNDNEFHDQVASGAEPDTASGRTPLQARCVQLARMGCLVFLYDMLGYGDSTEFDLIAIHAPSDETILDAPDRWGFYSTQAELRLQGPLGVQTYHSQCALDWLASLDDVDPNRIAVTGGSSGATQTLMLCAVDDRPVAAFPVVMVSNGMQGGCGCENACCLRIDTSNVEIAALMAPKPLGVASADDWTRDFQTDGWPQLQRVYAMLGASDRVMHASLIQFPHNYNSASRAAMYRWFDRHLGLGSEGEIAERAFTPVEVEEISITGNPKGRRAGGADLASVDGRATEVELMKSMDRESKRLLASLKPHDTASLDLYRATVGGALQVLVGAPRGETRRAAASIVGEARIGGTRVVQFSIPTAASGVELPAVALSPEHATSAVVCPAAVGKAAVCGENGLPTKFAAEILNRGIAVVGVDLFAQGDLAPSEGRLAQAPVVPDQRPAPSLTYGYNRTPVAWRALDLIDAIDAVREVLPEVEQISLYAHRDASIYATVAASLAGERLDAVAIDTGGFRFEGLSDWRSVDFLPGAVKYGDLPGLLALASPRRLLLAGESATDLDLTLAAYRAADAESSLRVAPAEIADEEVLDFLAGPPAD